MDIISVDPGLQHTGVFEIVEGKRRCWHIEQGKSSRYAHLSAIFRTLSKRCEEVAFRIGFVEDYAYRDNKSVMFAEIGGVIRAAMVGAGVPIVIMPIATWKSLTIGNKPKGTIQEGAAYVRRVNKLYGAESSTPDEADAFLIYYAAKMITERKTRLTDAAERLRENVMRVLAEPPMLAMHA
ncbi:MAG: hypothetical protein IMZ71_05705 [Chloroflexi bacterium]|nr:hypothetical protein [Chloroflexota bacterium]